MNDQPRGDRACGTCVWFEDQSEQFREDFVPADGFCHWRMPATVAKDSTGWGNWHQKGSATVKKVDWCSCWQETKGDYPGLDWVFAIGNYSSITRMEGYSKCHPAPQILGNLEFRTTLTHGRRYCSRSDRVPRVGYRTSSTSIFSFQSEMRNSK